jgi:hypothetical protein
MNPYLLDTPAVVSFSGGRTSGYMLWHILQAFGGKLPDDVKVIFCNTGKERPETLDFVERCSQEWGVEIVWLEYRRIDGKNTFAVVDYATASRNGEPFAELIKVRNFLPNPVARFCTTELKVMPLRDYCRTLGWEHWNSAVGIRADEPHRLAKGKQQKTKEWDVVHPLGDSGVTLGNVVDFWKAQPFDLQLDSHEGNCDLCFLKGAGKIRRIMAERPDLAEWWINQEQSIARHHGGTGHFRRDRPAYRIQLELAQRPTLFDEHEADELSIACHCTD